MDQYTQERPTIRQITVDLRPILGQVVDACEANISDPPKTSKQVNKSDARTDIQSSQQRSPGAISISLPSVSSCKSREHLRPPQPVQQTVSLVAITDEGRLTCDPIQKCRNSFPVFFPKVILNQEPLQKTSKEQRPLHKEVGRITNENTEINKKTNASWLSVEKLQLPMSELVRVVRERTNNRHHTLIAQVLCSLREEQEKLIHQGGQDFRLRGMMHIETSHNAPSIPCADVGTRFTWMKRS